MTRCVAAQRDQRARFVRAPCYRECAPPRLCRARALPTRLHAHLCRAQPSARSCRKTMFAPTVLTNAPHAGATKNKQHPRATGDSQWNVPIVSMRGRPRVPPARVADADARGPPHGLEAGRQSQEPLPSLPTMVLEPRERWVETERSPGGHVWVRLLGAAAGRAPRGWEERPWTWYRGGTRRSKRAIRKQRKSRAARARRLTKRVAAGRGEDDLPGKRRPLGAPGARERTYVVHLGRPW